MTDEVPYEDQDVEDVSWALDACPSVMRQKGQAAIGRIVLRLAALTAQVERLRDERDDERSTLASITDRLNTVARERGVVEAQRVTLTELQALVDRLSWEFPRLRAQAERYRALVEAVDQAVAHLVVLQHEPSRELVDHILDALRAARAALDGEAG